MARIVYGTLTADTVETVTVDGGDTLEVLNRDGADEIFFRFDKHDPAVEGDDCFCVPAAMGAVEVETNIPSSHEVEVRLISAGIPKYSVSVT